MKTKIKNHSTLLGVFIAVALLFISCSKDDIDNGNDTGIKWKLPTVTEKGITVRATSVDYVKGDDLAEIKIEVKKVDATIDKNLDVVGYVKTKSGDTYTGKSIVEYNKLMDTGNYADEIYIGVPEDRELDPNSLTFKVVNY